MQFDETAESRSRHYDEDFHMMDVDFVFCSVLECKSCGNIVACCGIGGYDPEPVYENGDPSVDYIKIFVPRFFSEPLPVIKFGPWPKTLLEQVKLSFQVFFCDLGAAANHIRSSVEELLTGLEIPLQDENGKRIPLDRRIQIFRETDAENAERAEALKLIGNVGSHAGTLTKDDVFDLYDILEILLEDIYVGHYRSIRRKVQEINRNRGKRNPANFDASPNAVPEAKMV